MATATSWDFMDPANKDLVLRTLDAEMDHTFQLVDDPGIWEAPTACEGWEVRDVIGHLVDATEGYFPGFDAARDGGEMPEPFGLTGMAKRVDEHARAFRSSSRDEMTERLRDDRARMMEIFEGLSADDWTGLMVAHPYMGPIPSMFYPMFQMVDYAVHSWDIEEGLGTPHALSADAVDLLVPVIFILWQATADTAGVTEPYCVGIRTSGRNGSEMRMNVTGEGIQYEPGSLDDCVAVLDFDPASLVLTAYGRINGGCAHGDRAKASDFRSLFFAI
jgi:uncharacterized protein (TIGR03083 family)